jgi:two-component system chemotaxis response regulator CheY
MGPDAEQNAPFKCLIADDSQFARKNIANIIMKLGGDVVAEAANGTEAVELYARHRPDLVLLDITMPQLDGVDTLRRIMEQDKNAKVVVVSSLGGKEMIWKAISLGARSFVTKPFSPEYASMIIEDVVRGGTGGKQ